jgi:hypothetical protein
MAAGAAFIAIIGTTLAINFAIADTPPSSMVAITPCRLVDTRPNSQVGDRDQALRAGETMTLGVTGEQGNCNIPTSANSIVSTVTVANQTATSNLTIWPADAARPVSSNMTWSAGGPAVANQVTVALSAAGEINVRNTAGNVHVIIDIAGFFQANPPTPTSGNWGVVNRNTIGSPVAELRNGPAFPAAGSRFKPPFGTGSLNLGVGTADEKVAYGNEFDFVGADFSAITDVGFRVFTVAENAGSAPMPNIAFEINPNLSASPLVIFATVTYVPTTTLPGWSSYIDGTTTGLWGGTGQAFAGTPCDLNGSLCSWDTLQAQLDDDDSDPPTILSVMITKGRDQAWHGAVDGLRVGATVYDFEESGVTALPAE